jgi:membrane protein DedA with SNARE-associated domain
MLITMAVLAGVAALVLATCGGYYFGRRAGSSPSTWKRRTSRIALGKLAVSLLAVTTVRRVRRKLRAEGVPSDAVGICLALISRIPAYARVSNDRT